MKNLGIIILCLCTCLLSLGCGAQASTTFDRLLAYQSSYIGDASAVGGIIRELPGADCHKGIELQTAQAPYGVTIKYDTSNSQWANINQQNLVMYNSAALFALIDNVDSITYSFEDEQTETLHILRADIENIIDHEWTYYLESVDQWKEGLYKPLYLEE